MHVINGEFYSGAERVQDLLAQGLVEEGFDVGFICLKPGRFPRERKALDAPLYEMPMRSRFDLKVAHKIARLVKAENYQLIHAHTPRSVFIGRFATSWARVPLVYHVHSPANQDCTNRLRNLANDLFERFSLRRVNALIPVSASLADFMKSRGYSSDDIFPVSNGVPSPVLCRSSAPPGREWCIGTIALFRPRKGLEFLLEAIALVRKAGHSVRLRAIGPFETPEYELQIRAKVRTLGLDDHIDWTGFVSDVPAELAKLDIAALPSLFGEGLPMVLLEAMAAGVPVIGSDVDGIRDAVQHERDGLLARPADAEELASCICRLMSGEIDWSTLRRNAMNRHSHEFSDRAMSARVAGIYRRILEPASQGVDRGEICKSLGSSD